MAGKNLKTSHDELLSILKERFLKHMTRHKSASWDSIQKLLVEKQALIATVQRMEDTGGEPDVVEFNSQLFYVDCAKESPAGRRSVCYDQKALNSRKENKPANSAEGMANEIGAVLLTEDQYRLLQQTGAYDLKTSSWIQTPEAIRSLGGALFCDRRYNHVFTYHNGAESYYAARGFRVCIALE